MYGTVVLVSTLLFFREGMGLNTLLFVGLLILSLFIDKSKPIKNDAFSWFFMAGCLLSAVAIVFCHSSLSILGLVVFVLLLIGYQKLASQSVFIVLLNSAFSVLPASFFWIHKNLLDTNKTLELKPRASRSQQLVVLQISAVVIPIAVVTIFLSLYASANPLFSKAFEWVSFDWLPFTLFLGVLLAGLFFYHPLTWLNNWHAQQGFKISRRRKPLVDAHPLSLKFELKTASILLLLLNLLLLGFNIADIHYFISGITQVKNFSHAEIVHQGINTLIVSIILAISITLLFQS